MKVEILEEHHPVGLATREFLGLAEVSQILVIGEQSDGMSGPLQVMAPVFESMNDGEQLPIVDVIISFSGRECLREISTGVEISVTILLHKDSPASNKGSVSHDDKRTTDIRKMQHGDSLE